MIAVPNFLREYVATYHDGTQMNIMARSARDAVMSAAELHKSRVVKCLPVGEWC
jgi:hypothetical protein